MIPVNEPLVGERELEYVTDAIKSGWISSSGSYLDRFESAWAVECGREHGIAVSNGTVALQLAVACFRFPPGSEIIMPSFTIVSCALAAIYNDCVPVFVDCDPATFCMNVSGIEEKMTDRTRAIMPVHIYGHPVEMERLLEIAERNDLVVIEDAAEAHGGRCRVSGEWRPCGSFGDVSTFSFYGNKLVTTGEGGMLVTDDDDLAERARSLRNLAFLPERRFIHEELGFNFRMTNIQAALGLAQVERFEEIVAKKRWMADRYREQLMGVPFLHLPEEKPWARSVYWMYAVLLDDLAPFDAAGFAARLRERGVDTRPFFSGLHDQPALALDRVSDEGAYPVTDAIGRRGLYLPSGLTLSEEDIETVAGAVREVLTS